MFNLLKLQIEINKLYQNYEMTSSRSVSYEINYDNLDEYKKFFFDNYRKNINDLMIDINALSELILLEYPNTDLNEYKSIKEKLNLIKHFDGTGDYLDQKEIELRNSLPCLKDHIKELIKNDSRISM